MNDMKNLLTSGVIALIISIVVVTLMGGGQMGPQGPAGRDGQNVGASSGPDHYSYEQFFGGSMYGNANSTSTPASMTLSVNDIAGYDVVVVNPTGAAAAKTLTFFASSTARSWLPKTGNMQRTCIMNATTTAGVTLVFAAGTGIDLETSSTSPTDLTLLPGNTACFNFIRATTTATTFDITADMTEFTDGD